MKKDIIQNKKKVGRNDLLNLPSSDDEKIVVSTFPYNVFLIEKA